MASEPADTLYERDFYAWTQREARALRAFARLRPNVPLDLPRIALEIQDLGKEQRNALRSWTARIIDHLLLLEHSRAVEPRRGWIREVQLSRREIQRSLTPTLRRDLQRQLPALHAEARADLLRRLALYGERDTLRDPPEACPYTLEQVLGDWWPDPAGEAPG